MASPILPPAKKILWVDDRPENNQDIVVQFERRGFHVSFALSTSLAMALLARNTYIAVISDMGRAAGPREGYHLLDLMRAKGDETTFFVYAGSSEPAHVEETLLHGGQGSTRSGDELLKLVTAVAEQQA